MSDCSVDNIDAAYSLSATLDFAGVLIVRLEPSAEEETGSDETGAFEEIVRCLASLNYLSVAAGAFR
jgi:hypothetical protein